MLSRATFGLLLLLPLHTRYVLAEPGTQFTTIAIYGFDIAFIVVLGLFVWWWNRTKQSLSSRQYTYLFRASVVVVLIVLAGIWSANELVTAHAALRFSQGVLLALMLMVGPLPTRTASLALIANGTFQASIAMWQVLTQSVVGIRWMGMADQIGYLSGTSIVATDVGRFIRAFGTQPHPNVAGGVIVVGLVAAAILWRAIYTEPHRRSKLEYRLNHTLLGAAVVVMNFGLVLTFSRTAIATWILLLVVMLTLRYRAGWLLTVSMITLVLAVWIYRPYIEARVNPVSITTHYAEQHSLDERSIQLTTAETSIRTSPLYGTGMWAYTIAGEGARQPIHNVAILTLAELGMLAWAALWWFMIQPIWSALRKNTPTAIGVGLLGVSILLLGLLDHYWWTLPNMLLLWFVVIGLQWREV